MPVSDEQALCLHCGLCCDGSLFAWVKLRYAELEPAIAAGLRVYGRHPADRGFAQPCSAFVGNCGIYNSGFYPKSCLAFRCALLKHFSKGDFSDEEALRIIHEAKDAAAVLRALLALVEDVPDRTSGLSLRDALAELEPPEAGAQASDLRRITAKYLRLVDEHFGVNGINDPFLNLDD